jgi:hypothetical protein
MAIPAIIARSFNLAFRGSEARAKSPATTLWGLLRLAQKPKSAEIALSTIGRRILSGKITSIDLMFLPAKTKEIFARALQRVGVLDGVLTSTYLLNPTLANLAQKATDPGILAALCENTNTVRNFTVGYDDESGRKNVQAEIAIGQIAALNPQTRPADASSVRPQRTAAS